MGSGKANSCGGVVSYGSSVTVNGVAVPSTDNAGNTGNALGISAGWGQDIIYSSPEVTLPAGTYKLEFYGYNANSSTASGVTNYLKSLFGFVPSSGTTSYLCGKTNWFLNHWDKGVVYFTLNEDTKGHFQAGAQSMNSTSTTNAKVFFDNIKLYKIIDSDDATSDDPADLTYLVTNPNFDSDGSGWTYTTGAQNHSTATNKGDAFNVPFYENWNPSAYTGKIYQEVTGLPSGTYTVGISAFVGDLGTTGSQYVYAGDTKVNVTSTTPTAYTIENVVVTNGSLEIGLELTEAKTTWVGIDNVTLTYYGATEEQLKTGYESALAAAKDAQQKETTDYAAVTGDEKTALDAAITQYGSVTSSSEYKTATKALTSATTAFTEAKASYEALVAAKKTADPNLQYASAGAKTAFTNAINATATSASDAATKTAAITTALRAYYESNSVAGGVTGAESYTSKITNPNAESVDGWTKAQMDGNAGIDVKSNEPFTDADGSSTHSYFDGGNWSGSDWTTKFEQELSSVPSGKYILAVTARGETNLTWFQLYADDAKQDMTHEGGTVGTGIFDRGWNDNVLVFTTAGNPTIGVTARAKEGKQWQSFTRFRLTRIGDLDEVELSGDANAAPTATTDYVKATLSRTFATGWNSVVLPFETTPAALGADQAAEFTGTSETTINFSSIASTGTLKANTPYLVHFTTASESPVFDGVKIAPTESLTVEDNGSQYDFVGTYVATTAKAGDYVVVEKGIQKAAGGNAVKAFRAYFQAKEGAGAKTMSISIDGSVVTGIEAVAADAEDDAPAYNLAGQRVGKSYKGVVVKNGKKIIKK